MKRKTIYLVGIIAVLFIVFAVTSSVFSGKPDSRINAFNNSIAQAEKGNYNEAIKELTNIYSNYSNDYLVNLRLGYLYYLTKKYDESIKFYSKAVELKNNQSVEAYFGLVLPLAAREKWNDVAKSYEKIMSLDPNNYTANLRMGQILINRKEYKNADQYLSKVYRLYPSDYETNLSYGWNLFYLNRKSEAKEKFIYVLMVSKDDASAAEGLNLVN
ncbi:MAG: tetratricopeptide repeat protein [Bacteroidetes bacterium]|nr:tetratricopeptide repeat protein [Bacteroidota bacterium]